MLDLEEVVEAMEEVVRLAKEAGEHGSAEGWVLLGDLYLVRKAWRTLKDDGLRDGD